MHLALTDLFRAKWTAQIHDEWMRNVLADRPDLIPAKVERVRILMDTHVSDCLVTGYEELIPTLALPDPNDRHVLAAAIRGQANVIVTYNLSDFPKAVLGSYGIVAQHPDDFIVRLLGMNQEKVLGAVRDQRLSLQSPSKIPEELLDTFAQQRLPQTVAALRPFLGRI
jgi:hypothetical protein